MTALEMKMSLLQEVMSMEDDALIQKALRSIRRLKAKTLSLEPAETDEYAEPTKEEILDNLRVALQDVKDLREGKDVGHKFMDAKEWLNSLED